MASNILFTSRSGNGLAPLQKRKKTFRFCEVRDFFIFGISFAKFIFKLVFNLLNVQFLHHLLPSVLLYFPSLLLLFPSFLMENKYIYTVFLTYEFFFETFKKTAGHNFFTIYRQKQRFSRCAINVDRVHYFHYAPGLPRRYRPKKC